MCIRDRWGQTQMRVHNCYPAEMPLLWNFMKHYSYTTDENGYVTARYYSESAFAEDDLVEIEKQDPETVATDLTEENVPKIDVTRGNKLPLTGYLNKMCIRDSNGSYHCYTGKRKCLCVGIG